MTGAWAMVAVGVMLAQGAVPFTPLTRGAMSGIDTPRYVVVRTDEDWRRVWAAHTTRDERPDAAGSRSAPQILFSSRCCSGTLSRR